MNKKITNGLILTHSDSGFNIEKKDLYIRNGMISFKDDGSEHQIIDASRRLVMPGFINMHTHAYMSFLRNYADDIAFNDWLFNRIMPVEDRMDPQDAYWTSLFSCIEMIGTGTTCFLDMHMFEGQSCRAAEDIGMRAYIGRGLVGDDIHSDGRERLDQAMREKEEYGSDLIRFILSPHAIYSCSPKFLEQIAELARKTDSLKQTHLSESENEVRDSLEKYGKTPVEVFRDCGFLDEKTILAHCVQLNDSDIEIIKNAGSSIVTNPSSNAKLANGWVPITKFLDKGINVCIGTDSVASNNALNMFREMGILSLLHKAVGKSSTVLPADCVLGMATVNAARALGRKGELGEISEGAAADLVFVDLDATSMFPNNNIVSSMCYSANGSEVDSVMINGEFVMKNREYVTVDREKVLFEVNRIREKYLV